jgi:cell division protein FtsB
MARPLNQSAVIKELDRVGDKLAAKGLAADKRMALLRRQAQLGDLRDAIAQRARRAAAS